MQLRRVVELAGMSARCDFDEQVAVTTDDGAQRPDMVIRLAGGKHIVVDSKVSLAAYLEAAEATDSGVRNLRLDAHARHLREHVDRLAAKAYWTALSPAPEFVVLFIPGEAFLAPALEHDPALLEYAMAHRVHIATPTTLVTMLRTAQYAWQQAALSDNARAVFDLGRELYDRLAGLGKHVDSLGKALTNAVSTYNRTVGTLESRVLVSARKLNQLGLVEAELAPPKPVDRPGAVGGRAGQPGRPGTRHRNRNRPGPRRCASRPAAGRASSHGRSRLRMRMPAPVLHQRGGRNRGDAADRAIREPDPGPTAAGQDDGPRRRAGDVCAVLHRRGRR
jgi:DNA recombination protein RmuC